MNPNDAALPQEHEFEATIASLTARNLRLWNETPATMPTGMRTFFPAEQTHNERRILGFIDDPVNRKDLQTMFAEPGRATSSTLRRLAILNFFNESAGEHPFGEASGQFADATGEFVLQARTFDPEISSGDLAQALRNLWVFCSFRYLANLDIRVTPSALAYSLLYPYTDNYLDDQRFSRTAKQNFGARVCAELRDPGLKPHDKREAQVFSLIGMIGEEYPRKQYPLVHRSLEAIHSAQRNSLAQHGEENRADVLLVSFEKGGTSVLADAMLAGTVRDGRWLEMAFGYGCVLQLIDDLQDAEKDYERNHRTTFSTTLCHESLEVKSLHLLRFLHAVVASWPSFPRKSQPPFKSLIAESCCFLIFEAVARMRARYSSDFLESIEKRAPASLAFLASLRERVRSVPSPGSTVAM